MDPIFQDILDDPTDINPKQNYADPFYHEIYYTQYVKNLELEIIRMRELLRTSFNVITNLKLKYDNEIALRKQFYKN